MTLVNAWRDAEAAWLVADTAHFDENGVVLGFGGKMFGAADWNAVVAVSSLGLPMQLLMDAFAASPPDNCAELQAMMPAVCDKYVETSRAEGWSGARIRLVVVAWCKDLGEPRIFVCQKGSGPFDSGAAYETDYVLTENGRMPDRVIDKIKRKEPLDTQGDIIPLIEAQRADNFPGTNFRAIGGDVHLVRVSEEQIWMDKIHSWPDKVGERIGGKIESTE